MKKRMLFLFNPTAGKGKIKAHLWEIVDIFNKGGYEVIIHATQCSRDAYEQVKIYEDQVDLIVCSGGDGTLDEVVTGLVEKNSNTPVGYLPAGSTNDFANSLFMPKDIVEMARNIMEEVPYCCDIGKFNDSTFVYVAAFGLFTEVSYATDQELKNTLGHLAYLLEGLKSLVDIKAYHMKISSDELTVENDFIYGMITNSRSVGGFRNLTGKNVDMDDGLFEVTLIARPRNPLELNEIVTALVTATDNTELVHTFKTSHLNIETEETVAWTLDGEFGGNVRNAEIRIMRKGLNLYLRSTKKRKNIEEKENE